MNIADNSTRRRSVCLTAGDFCRLDGEIEPGLFEDCDRNRYLILSGTEKLAIALHHSTLPPFTCLTLGRSRLASGRWWGRPRLRLSHALDPNRSSGGFGTIEISDGHAQMCVRSLHNDTMWFVVGSTADRSVDCLFNGWILTAADLPFPFFKQKLNGKTSLGKPRFDPRFQSEISIELMNIKAVLFRV